MEHHITASSGGVVYAVQNGDQYVYLYREQPAYRVESYQAEPPPLPGPLVRRAPSWLLAARPGGQSRNLSRCRVIFPVTSPGRTPRTA